MSQKKNMLFIGSPPPPYHGQAVITGIVFETGFSNIDATFYKARFSEELSSVGGFSVKKLLVLLRVWMRMLTYAVRKKKPRLYYCAGSANTVPFLRDVILLGTVGKLFNNRYIHYHSGGLPEWLGEKSWRKVLGKWCYDGKSISIACSRYVEVPLGNGNVMELPNGLEVPELVKREEGDGPTRFLYVGALRETKGVRVLLEAAQQMAGERFELDIVGEWVSEKEERNCLSVVSEGMLDEKVNFLGRLTGEDKWEAFQRADVFVFPTFYESENMPLVIIEALGCGLPVISTHWRSIPNLVQDGETGFLVAPRDAERLAEKMRWSLENKGMLEDMRGKARSAYEQHYSVQAFQSNLKVILGDGA